MSFTYTYKPNPKLSEIYNSLLPGSVPGNSMAFSTATRILPNGGGSYTAPVVAQTPAPVTPAPVVKPAVSTPAPVVKPAVSTPAPVVKPPVVTPAPLDYSKYTDPVTGKVMTPQEYADMVGKRLTSGTIPTYAGNTLTEGKQTAEQLQTTAAGLNNARNDIATGATDPYNAASKSGIAYSPQELAAIEKAYAGIYDPAINSALAKLDAKQKEDEAALASKNRLAEMAQQHKYDLELKQTPSGTAGGTGGVYVAGENPAVDAFAELIWNGKATMATVPKEYKMQVASAMQTYGNQINGKPTTTEIGKQKLTAAKKLLAMFDKGEGISVVGKSRLFGGGIATPGSKSADFYSLADQLMSMAQLDASKFLKGQGQVSDAERAILANAATSLKYSQSEELFRKTLVEMINVLEGNVPPEEEVNAGTGGEVLRSPDGTQEVTVSDLTPEELAEARANGWK